MEHTLTVKNTMISNETISCQEELEMLRNRMAELTKETNQFTYIVTHDLQAPLRMVTGFLELLEKRYADQLDDTAKQFIGHAVKGSVKMKNLIFDLLEYSRLNSSAHVFEEIELAGIVEEVKEEFAPVISFNNAIIEMGALPRLIACRKMFSQLFRHLLDNALKFRSTARPHITIDAEETVTHWRISIRDNGLGIDPAFFDRIFVVFKRLHSDEEKYSGTGMGLAICKKIAELHRGNIGVDSAPGMGSTFHVTLPKTDNPFLK